MSARVGTCARCGQRDDVFKPDGAPRGTPWLCPLCGIAVALAASVPSPPQKAQK